MIEGLKLTMTGVQLRAHIEGRIRWHQEQMQRLSQSREPGSNQRSHEAHDLDGKRAERQIETLMFIRDYIVADEVYRLGEFDLRFADLLPDEDPWDCGCEPAAFMSGGSLPKVTMEPN